MTSENENRHVLTRDDMNTFWALTLPQHCMPEHWYVNYQGMDPAEETATLQRELRDQLKTIAKSINTELTDDATTCFIHEKASHFLRFKDEKLLTRMLTYIEEFALDHPPADGAADPIGLNLAFREMIHRQQGGRTEEWKETIYTAESLHKRYHVVSLCKVCNKKARGHCQTCTRFAHPQPAGYCSYKCQHYDRDAHHGVCQDWRSAVKRQRAADLLRELYLVVKHAEDGGSMGRIQERNGILYHHATLRPRPRLPFPSGATQEERDRRSVYLWNQCILFPGRMHTLITAFFSSVAATVIGELDSAIQNANRPVTHVHHSGKPDPAMRRTHNVLILKHHSLVQKAEQNTYFDGTSLQFGWPETLVPDFLYRSHRFTLQRAVRSQWGHSRARNGGSTAWTAAGALFGPPPEVLGRLVDRVLARSNLTLDEFFDLDGEAYEGLRDLIVRFCVDWLERSEWRLCGWEDWVAFPLAEDVFVELDAKPIPHVPDVVERDDDEDVELPAWALADEDFIEESDGGEGGEEGEDGEQSEERTENTESSGDPFAPPLPPTTT